MDELTYAIGDIHGCARQLDQLLVAIQHHRAGRLVRLVFLGDYIDRGPESARVVRRLRRLTDVGKQRVTCLAGNHEDMMLQARRDRHTLRAWLSNGGVTTLASYGATNLADLPEDDVRWLASLPTLHEDRAHYFVHAGLRPGVTIRDSDPQDRLWIREAFLRSRHDFGKHVVHGHTPRMSGAPDLLPHRTNLDTAAVFGCSLTAGVFIEGRGPPISYIQVDAGGACRTVEVE